jgi:DNA-binding NarL/FixJ family response regulator
VLYPSSEECEHIGRLGLPARLETGLYSDVEDLSAREREIAQQLVTGKTGKHIGRSLGIGPPTV